MKLTGPIGMPRGASGERCKSAFNRAFAVSILSLWIVSRLTRRACSTWASQEDYHATRDQVFFQIKDALVEVETQQALVLLLRDTHIPQAEQSLEATTAGYQTATVDFLSLIDSLRVLEDFRLALFQAMADFEKRWAELERVVGRELSRV